jgi:iron complex outermembrane receptor protein
VGGSFIDKLIAENNSAIARKAGILPLKQETAQNASVGMTLKPIETVTITLDAYSVNVKDRIVLTGAFGQSDPNIGSDLTALNVGGVQFFVNGLDTKTTGLDAVVSYLMEYKDHHLRLSFAGNFNDMKLGAIKPGPKLGAQGDTVFFGRREQYFLLASAPPRKLALSIDHTLGRLHSSLRFVNFGAVSLVNWVDHLDVYEAKTTTDLSVGYDVNDNLTLVVGASNLANVYPTKQDVANTESGGLWDAVQMGFSGRFYFTKLNVRF